MEIRDPRCLRSSRPTSVIAVARTAEIFDRALDHIVWTTERRRVTINLFRLEHSSFTPTRQKPASKHPSLQFTMAYMSVAFFCCLPLSSQRRHTLYPSTSAQKASEKSPFATSTTPRFFLAIQSPLASVALHLVNFVGRSYKSFSSFFLTFGLLPRLAAKI